MIDSPKSKQNHQKGFIDIISSLGIAIILVGLFTASQLNKQSQDIRKSAMMNNDYVIDTPTPTPTPTDYQNPENQTDTNLQNDNTDSNYKYTSDTNTNYDVSSVDTPTDTPTPTPTLTPTDTPTLTPTEAISSGDSGENGVSAGGEKNPADVDTSVENNAEPPTDTPTLTPTETPTLTPTPIEPQTNIGSGGNGETSFGGEKDDINIGNPASDQLNSENGASDQSIDQNIVIPPGEVISTPTNTPTPTDTPIPTPTDTPVPANEPKPGIIAGTGGIALGVICNLPRISFLGFLNNVLESSLPCQNNSSDNMKTTHQTQLENTAENQVATTTNQGGAGAGSTSGGGGNSSGGGKGGNGSSAGGGGIDSPNCGQDGAYCGPFGSSCCNGWSCGGGLFLGIGASCQPNEPVQVAMNTDQNSQDQQDIDWGQIFGKTILPDERRDDIITWINSAKATVDRSSNNWSIRMKPFFTSVGNDLANFSRQSKLSWATTKQRIILLMIAINLAGSTTQGSFQTTGSALACVIQINGIVDNMLKPGFKLPADCQNMMGGTNANDAQSVIDKIIAASQTELTTNQQLEAIGEPTWTPVPTPVRECDFINFPSPGRPPTMTPTTDYLRGWVIQMRDFVKLYEIFDKSNSCSLGGKKAITDKYGQAYKAIITCSGLRQGLNNPNFIPTSSNISCAKKYFWP